MYFCFQSLFCSIFSFYRKNEIFLSTHKSLPSSDKTWHHAMLLKIVSTEKSKTKPSPAFSLKLLILIFLNVSAVTHTFTQDWILRACPIFQYSFLNLQLQSLVAQSFQQTWLVSTGFIWDMKQFFPSRLLWDHRVIIEGSWNSCARGIHWCN